MAAFLFTVAIALALRHSYYRAAKNVEVNETCGKVKYILRLLYAEYEEIRDIYLYYDSYGDKLMNL